MSVIVRSWFLGRTGYNRALHLQKKLVELNSRPDNKCPAYTILMLEHSPVYTVGIRSEEYSNKYQEELRNCGAQFVKIARGGLITYHGPGQLMAYPIVNLQGNDLAGKGLRWYVKALEQAGFEACQSYKADGFRKGSELFPDKTAATGVWLNEQNKIMSIGVHASRNIAFHGLGLNCTKEPLAWFDKIVPCGLANCKMTSLETVTGVKLTPAVVAPILSEHLFANLFNYQNDLAFTYADFLSEDESLSWEKVCQFILEDADFRTKKLPSQEVSQE
ncbi:hypothetical protein Aperf_G00000011038 [Anoplocephala perfoliata]